MPYSRRSRFKHEERARSFEPERIRTVTYPDGTEVRLGFKGDRSEVVAVLTPKETPAQVEARFAHDAAVRRGSGGKSRVAIARELAADREGTARHAKIVAAYEAQMNERFERDGINARYVGGRIVPVRPSRRARGHDRRLR